jgi:hypothetical protein
VATSSSGDELASQAISIRFSIIKDTPAGQAIYAETHSPTTDAFGLFTVQIGAGNVITGTFANIDWSTGSYFLKTDMDVTGGSNYVNMGTTQMVSVPYALYASKSNTATTANTAIHANTADNAIYSDTAIYVQHALFADSTSVAGSAANADNANTADFAIQAGTAIDDFDKNPTNEIQELSYNNGVLTITPGLGGTGAPQSISISDGDGDPTNELQTLSFDPETNILTLSGSSSSIELSTGLFTAPGASLDYPLGIVASPVVIGSQEYTVPDGKCLFITAAAEQFQVRINNVWYTHNRLPGFPVFSSPAVGSPQAQGVPVERIKDCRCTGLLFDESDLIQPVFIDLNSVPAYTVPTGKTLVIKSGLVPDGYLIIDGQVYDFLDNPVYSGNIVLPSGSTVAKLLGLGSVFLSGYLYDSPN